MEDTADVGKVAAEQPDTADVDCDASSADVKPDAGPGVGPSAEVVPDSLIPVPVVVGQVDDVVSPVVGGNNLELSSAGLSVGSSCNNIVSETPPAVNLVDKDGIILPTLPAITGLLGNIVPGSLPAWEGEKATSHAGVKYVDQNGRVLTCVPYPLSVPDTSQVIRVVDGNGQVVTSKEQSNTVVVDKDGRVISRTNTSPRNAGISATNDVDESGAGNFWTSVSASSLIQSVARGLATRQNSTEGSNRSNSAYSSLWNFCRHHHRIIKHLVTLSTCRRYINKCIYLSIYLSIITVIRVTERL